jgi:hypothetical protein
LTFPFPAFATKTLSNSGTYSTPWGSSKPFDAWDDLGLESINDFHRVVTQRGKNHKPFFGKRGEVVNAAGHSWIGIFWISCSGATSWDAAGAFPSLEAVEVVGALPQELNQAKVNRASIADSIFMFLHSDLRQSGMRNSRLRFKDEYCRWLLSV